MQHMAIRNCRPTILWDKVPGTLSLIVIEEAHFVQSHKSGKVIFIQVPIFKYIESDRISVESSSNLYFIKKRAALNWQTNGKQISVPKASPYTFTGKSSSFPVKIDKPVRHPLGISYGFSGAEDGT